MVDGNEGGDGADESKQTDHKETSPCEEFAVAMFVNQKRRGKEGWKEEDEFDDIEDFEC